MDDALQNLIEKVVQWGHDRNLNAPDNLKAQTMKLVSEFGEIGAAVAEYNFREVKDGIGDSIVVAIIIGQQIGYPVSSEHVAAEVACIDDWEYERASGALGRFVDMVLKSHPHKQLALALYEFLEGIADFAAMKDVSLFECLSYAYDQIKDRNGVMYQGAFIKESDPRYIDVMKELGKAI